MRTKDIAINGALAALSVLCTIGVLEIGLRVSGIERGRPVPVPIYVKSANPAISYALKPNMKVHALRSTITTDAHGFRSPEPDPKKPTVVFLGDSITFGYGLQDTETIPAKVQSIIGPAWNVVNMAVPGYNATQEVATYRDAEQKLRPRALVLVFFFNDLVSMDPAILDTDGAVRPVALPPGQTATCAPVESGVLSFIPGSCWLDLHSSVYRILKKIALTRSGNTQKVLDEKVNAAKFFSESLPPERVNRYGTILENFAKTLPPSMPRLFVIWPDREIHWELRQKLTAIASRQGFRVLDLYSLFGNRAETLSWDTSHPSARTAAEAGTVIAAALQEWHLLPEDASHKP